MDNKKMCRLCAILVAASRSRNLFRRCQQRLLQQIEELTGLQLEYEEDLPHLVCVTCLKQIEQAHDFRERCIQVQQQFTTAKWSSREKEEKVFLEICINGEEFVPEDEDVYYSEDEQKAEEVNELNNSEEVNIQEDEKAIKQEDEEVDLLPITEVMLEQESAEDNGEMTYSTDDYTPGSEAAMEKTKTIKRKKKTKTKSKNELKALQSLYKCNLCGNSYSNRTNFLSHQLRHGEKEFQCEICTMKFFTKREVKGHMRVHTGEKPYACQYCDKRFGSCTNKGLHELTHSNMRPFECQQCGKAFKSSKDLNQHMTTHSDLRPFECRICNVSFTISKYLRQHYRSSSTHKLNAEKLEKKYINRSAKEKC